MPYPPISDYAMLSDCHGAALVSRAGSVDWCCFHRFDSRPVFARLLDWEKGGHFRVSPAGDHSSTRRYLPGTNVLETTFDTGEGRLVLTDCLAIGAGGEPIDSVRRHHQLLRHLRAEGGPVEVTIEFAPRFDYGLTTPRLVLHDPHRALVYGGADGLTLTSDLPLDRQALNGCRATATLAEGEDAYLVLTADDPHVAGAHYPGRDEAGDALRSTIRYWTDWSQRCTYEGPYREEVLRSALVLKGLTDARTGAIVAAATTSLPEEIGGVRNWDYRFSWLRDAALNLYALFTLGYTDEAEQFMAWLERTSAGRADDLQPLYGVGGERFLHEVELDWLEGYRRSAPVRMGNAAADQVQHDIYGELLDTAWLYHRNGGRIDEPFWEFIVEAVEVVDEVWDTPDEGIWEPRDRQRHFTSSKIFCWVAVDRAIKLARDLGLDAPIDRWSELSERIRTSIDENATIPGSGAFRRDYESDEQDAANLLAPLVKYVPPDDPRVEATVEDVIARLTQDGLVHRYRTDDGLEGEEGSFVICSFWLVDNLAMLGRVDEARELFERLCGYANDVGLLSEEVSETGELLGNFPQAFSHVGLIGAAINLQRATQPT
ncbi:MAG TPA: glycoside hydrolase family 15 protein [Actinomycetota bacterium]|nr:glycoside hydrolase family 15 protein [Actinomycetota bacterium]